MSKRFSGVISKIITGSSIPHGYAITSTGMDVYLPPNLVAKHNLSEAYEHEEIEGFYRISERNHEKGIVIALTRIGNNQLTTVMSSGEGALVEQLRREKADLEAELERTRDMVQDLEAELVGGVDDQDLRDKIAELEKTNRVIMAELSDGVRTSEQAQTLIREAYNEAVEAAVAKRTAKIEEEMRWWKTVAHRRRVKHWGNGAHELVRQLVEDEGITSTEQIIQDLASGRVGSPRSGGPAISKLVAARILEYTDKKKKHVKIGEGKHSPVPEDL